MGIRSYRLYLSPGFQYMSSDLLIYVLSLVLNMLVEEINVYSS